MATNIQCDSCESLREDHPKFILRGMTDTACENLSNNNGLDGTNDNCEDMHDMNDCLVGMMDKDVDSYEACDWKEFMHRFIPNVWTVLKGFVCWLCGVQCLVNYLFDGASFRIAEDSTGDSKLIPGTGVDFSIRSSGSEHTSDVTLLYVAGGFARLSGSLRCFAESFKDANGNTKSGNSVWNLNDRLPSGGELLLEVRIKKSEHPQIKKIYQGWGFPLVGHDTFYEVVTNIFDGDDSSIDCSSDNSVYAYGQHGWCDSCGDPSETGYSSGHKVPSGWIYIQMRLAYKGTMTSYTVKDGASNDKTGFDMTPLAQFGIRMDRGEIEC